MGICKSCVLRLFALLLVLIWPSGDAKYSGFYLLISNLQLSPKACQVFILMKYLTYEYAFSGTTKLKST